MADNFFSNMMGYNKTYTTETTKTQYVDETDYNEVDFCQGYDNNDTSIFGFTGEDEDYGYQA